MTERQSALIELIKKEVKPALGCTEPIAVALAVAKAIETLEENDFIQNRMGDDFVIVICGELIRADKQEGNEEKPAETPKTGRKRKRKEGE
mgnify:CR=1 FL=1